MFKDDYKLANNKITASSDLKKRTLEKMNVKKETKQHTYMRYGLVCASFLFVVAIFPVLYGSSGLTNDQSNPSINNISGVTMPQTGVDESVVYQDDGLIREYHKTTKKIEEELKQKQQKLDALVKKQQEPISDEKKQTEIKEKYEKEIIKIKAEVDTIISKAAAIVPPNSIVINEITEPLTQFKPRNFLEEEGYYEELWTDQQVVEYLGVSPIPTYLPEDLASNYVPSDTPTQKVIFNQDATIAFDTFSYYFCEPQLTREFNPTRRTLSVSVAKDKMPQEDMLYKSDTTKSSFLNGWTVTLSRIKKPYEFNDKNEITASFDRFVAEFVYNGVGYRVISDNLTQQEFTDVVSSLIVKIELKQTQVSSGESTPQK
ncbi:MAG: hypothetical protein RR444_00050 [Oscillospiraceae bacterium]